MSRAGPGRDGELTGLVVVFDAACGTCSGIASRLPDILAPEVLVRSCRDPRLTVEFPVLAGRLGHQPCARPLLVLLRAGGRAEVRAGIPMLLAGARLLAPRQRLAALRLAGRLGYAAARRRAAPADHGVPG